MYQFDIRNTKTNGDIDLRLTTKHYNKCFPLIRVPTIYHFVLGGSLVECEDII